ncbi:MAG: insulinase family protein [Tannerellaceae bacterium]|jgi:predicted Zn-dependent peptidase|nr:insulinase family protein [Tannerellaceae bacterium]
MHYFTHTFQDGLRLIHLPVDSPVAYCGFAVNAGARDEEADESGLAHFVEHLLFKGTEKRKAWHILNRMENVGGELNAYTTKEDTFVYSIFMEEHFARAFELLTDILFHSCFPPQEIEKEVDVILDEINTYKDNPSELIFDEFENLIFNGHALGHHILGDEASLRGFTSGSGLSFTRRFYVPSNMVFFSMGRIKPAKLIRLAEESRSLPSPSPFPAYCRKPPLPVPPQNKRIHRETHQTHVIIGGRSYCMYESDRKRIPLFLLNNLLGGPGMNSRLNISLREKHGLVYSVESNISSYTDTGLASIYFGTDPRHTAKAVSLVHKELKKLCDTRLSSSQLAAVKKQVTGQLGVSNDNKESLFLNLGKHFLHHNSYESLHEVFGKIENVTAGDILEAANEVFSPTGLSSLIYE